MDSVVIYKGGGSVKFHTFHTFIYFFLKCFPSHFFGILWYKNMLYNQNDFTSSGMMIQKPKVQTPKVKIPPIQQMRNPDGGFLAI